MAFRRRTDERALPRIVLTFASQVEQYCRGELSGEDLLTWLDDSENQDRLLRTDDGPSQWLSPQVWAQLWAARRGEIPEQQAHDAIVALIPGTSAAETRQSSG